jgi:hypothetical protein
MKSFITPLIVALILLCSLVNGQNTFTQISHYTPDEPDTSLPMPPITTLDTNEYKLVYWIHGIGGNVDSWNRTREATEDQTGHPIVGYPERKTIGLTVDYSNQQTLTMIGLSRWVNNNQIKSFINNNGLDTVDHDRSFAITHSMGGIVARGMRHNHLNMTLPVDSMKFGGMATFGAPHGGAQIINSIQQTNDGVNDWLQQGCTYLTDAEFQNAINKQHWLVRTFVSPAAISNLAQGGCDALSSTVFPLLIDGIRTPVGADIRVGAPVMNILDNTAVADTAFPVVVFYGVEQEPVLWRMVHTMTRDVDTSFSGNVTFAQPFGLNDDNGIPQDVNNLYNKYKGDAAYWSKIAANRHGWTWLGWPYPDRYFNALEQEKKFTRAYTWLGSANGMWKRFIGARYDTTYQNGYYCYCENEAVPTWVSDPAYCNSQVFNICYTLPNIVAHVTDIANDGVLTVKSQKAYPHTPWKVPMNTSNHFQERRTEETKEALNKLFGGWYGNQFRLNEK